MKDMNKKLKEFSTWLLEKGKEIVEDVIDFVKKHKKMVFGLFLLYMLYKFLFEEDRNEYDADNYDD